MFFSGYNKRNTSTKINNNQILSKSFFYTWSIVSGISSSLSAVSIKSYLFLKAMIIMIRIKRIVKGIDNPRIRPRLTVEAGEAVP